MARPMAMFLAWAVNNNVSRLAGSRPITEVKQRWACPVLGWVTAWEQSEARELHSYQSEARELYSYQSEARELLGAHSY